MKWNIANALTLGNLGFGFAAIILSDPFWSPLCIISGAILDLFDGALARRLGFEGSLGKELDSMADMVTFGVAPAYVYYQIAPSGIAPFIIFFCVATLPLAAAFRLARFNTLPASRVFRGLPSPSAGIFFAAWIWAVGQTDNSIAQLHQHSWLYLSLPLFFALLMNIPSPFFSLKDFQPNWQKGWSHISLFLAVLTLFLITPHEAGAYAILVYIFLSFSRNLIKT